jgi:hypothetical protein
LRVATLVLWHTDVGVDLQAPDFDGVRCHAFA